MSWLLFSVHRWGFKHWLLQQRRPLCPHEAHSGLQLLTLSGLPAGRVNSRGRSREKEGKSHSGMQEGCMTKVGSCFLYWLSPSSAWCLVGSWGSVRAGGKAVSVAW